MPVEGVRSPMPELDPVAKRIYNVHPDPVRLVLDDGSDGVFDLSSAEFFQREFQAEGRRVDDDADATYRLVTGEGDDLDASDDPPAPDGSTGPTESDG
jgi:hypothetical protein